MWYSIQFIDLPNLTTIQSNWGLFDNPRSIVLEGISQ